MVEVVSFALGDVVNGSYNKFYGKYTNKQRGYAIMSVFGFPAFKFKKSKIIALSDWIQSNAAVSDFVFVVHG